MDQYIVAMVAVVAFALFAAGAIIRMVRKDYRLDRDPLKDGWREMEEDVRDTVEKRSRRAF